MFDKVDKLTSRVMRGLLWVVAGLMLLSGGAYFCSVAGSPEAFRELQVGLAFETLGALFTFGFIYFLPQDDGGQEIGKLREEVRQLQEKIDRLIEAQTAPPESPAASEQSTVQETDTESM